MVHILSWAVAVDCAAALEEVADEAVAIKDHDVGGDFFDAEGGVRF